MTGDSIYYGQSLAGNTDVTKFVLDADEFIENATRSLSDTADGFNKSGKPVTYRIRPYKTETIQWFKAKLKEVSNKIMYLSNFNKEEMYREAKIISMNFNDELFFHVKEFELDASQYTELNNMYNNFLSPSIRRALFNGASELLAKTTSEISQKSLQTVTNANEPRKKILGLI